MGDPIIVVALIGLGGSVVTVMGVVVQQVMGARKEETQRHGDLDMNIAKIISDGENHTKQATKIGKDLEQHMADQRESNKVNTEAHTVLFSELGHIKGWIEGRREEK